MNYAPIVLFTYNRLEHVKKTIESLKENELANESRLYIFSDGVKDTDDQKKVNEVRKYLKSISGFSNVEIIERKTNYGLAKSIISGVTEILSKHERLIVLEDDLLISPYFLDYMNTALDMYEKNENVISIHGYVYPINNEQNTNFFIKGSDCWGWATWRRGWDLFNPNGQELLDLIVNSNKQREFDFDNSYPYKKMLEDQINGKNDSWAIRWYASAFVNDKLTLYPYKSLVKNIGFDGSGTHCTTNKMLDVELADEAIDFKKELLVGEDRKIRKEFKKFFKKLVTNGIKNKIFRILVGVRNVLRYKMYAFVKKMIPVSVKDIIKNVLSKFGIIKIVSGNYRVISKVDYNELKAKYGNVWKNDTIPNEQLKITEKQVGDYRKDNSMAALVNAVECIKDNGIDNVLEIGCSTGYFSEVFKKAGLKFDYTGCDYSKSFIDIAKSKYPNVSFNESSATELIYDDNSFDIAISGCCLLHIVDYARAIKETARVAKKYVIFHKTPVVHMTKTTYTVKKGYGLDMVEIIFNEEELIDIFKENNLLVEKISIIDTHNINSIHEPVCLKEYICKKINSLYD